MLRARCLPLVLCFLLLDPSFASIGAALSPHHQPLHHHSTPSIAITPTSGLYDLERSTEMERTVRATLTTGGGDRGMVLEEATEGGGVSGDGIARVDRSPVPAGRDEDFEEEAADLPSVEDKINDNPSTIPKDDGEKPQGSSAISSHSSQSQASSAMVRGMSALSSEPIEQAVTLAAANQMDSEAGGKLEQEPGISELSSTSEMDQLSPSIGGAGDRQSEKSSGSSNLFSSSFDISLGDQTAPPKSKKMVRDEKKARKIRTVSSAMSTHSSLSLYQPMASEMDGSPSFGEINEASSSIKLATSSSGSLTRSSSTAGSGVPSIVALGTSTPSSKEQYAGGSVDLMLILSGVLTAVLFMKGNQHYMKEKMAHLEADAKDAEEAKEVERWSPSRKYLLPIKDFVISPETGEEVPFQIDSDTGEQFEPTVDAPRKVDWLKLGPAILAYPTRWGRCVHSFWAPKGYEQPSAEPDSTETTAPPAGDADAAAVSEAAAAAAPEEAAATAPEAGAAAGAGGTDADEAGIKDDEAAGEAAPPAGSDKVGGVVSLLETGVPVAKKQRTTKKLPEPKPLGKAEARTEDAAEMGTEDAPVPAEGKDAVKLTPPLDFPEDDAESTAVMAASWLGGSKKGPEEGGAPKVPEPSTFIKEKLYTYLGPEGLGILEDQNNVALGPFTTRDLSVLVRSALEHHDFCNVVQNNVKPKPNTYENVDRFVAHFSGQKTLFGLLAEDNEENCDTTYEEYLECLYKKEVQFDDKVVCKVQETDPATGKKLSVGTTGEASEVAGGDEKTDKAGEGEGEDDYEDEDIPEEGTVPENATAQHMVVEDEDLVPLENRTYSSKEEYYQYKKRRHEKAMALKKQDEEKAGEGDPAAESKTPQPKIQKKDRKGLIVGFLFLLVGIVGYAVICKMEADTEGLNTSGSRVADPVIQASAQASAQNEAANRVAVEAAKANLVVAEAQAQADAKETARVGMLSRLQRA